MCRNLRLWKECTSQLVAQQEATIVTCQMVQTSSGRCARSATGSSILSIALSNKKKLVRGEGWQCPAAARSLHVCEAKKVLEAGCPVGPIVCTCCNFFQSCGTLHEFRMWHYVCTGTVFFCIWHSAAVAVLLSCCGKLFMHVALRSNREQT